MRAPIRIAIRGLLLSAAVTLLSIVTSAPVPGGSPYLSALSPLAGQPAYAAKSCNGHACIGGGHRHTNCGPLAGWMCTNLSHSCTDQMCV